jgi:DNA-binding CsgD family transcriptional regulator
MASQSVPRPEVLSEKELEILRLLAGGHTVKSIAVLLGRSEASINERLREARRKTGVGSSRELARMLAAPPRCLKRPRPLRLLPLPRSRASGRLMWRGCPRTSARCR